MQLFQDLQIWFSISKVEEGVTIILVQNYLHIDFVWNKKNIANKSKSHLFCVLFSNNYLLFICFDFFFAD